MNGVASTDYVTNSSVTDAGLVTIQTKAGAGAKTVTLWVEDSEGRRTRIDITIQVANYEVSSVASGKLKYQTTLKNAVAAMATSGTPTIKALNNTSESDTVTLSTNVTINTNGKTLTRTGGTIKTTDGTTTISGTGTVTNTATSGVTFTVSGGTFKTSGTPILISKHQVINGTGSTAISLAGGYLRSSTAGDGNYNGAVIYVGSGATNVTLSNTWVYVTGEKAVCINIKDGCTGTLTLSGATVVGAKRSSSKVTGIALINGSTGASTIKGTTKIIDNGGMHAIDLNGYNTKHTISFTETSSVYYSGAWGYAAINDYSSLENINNKMTFNSGGYFYSRGTIAWAPKNLVLTKGHFAYTKENGTNPAMFQKSNGNGTDRYTPSGTTGPSNRNFLVMKDYKTTETKSISGCYYVAIGF